MRLPWISREHHASVLAGKDDLIRSLQEQIAQLLKQAEKPLAVNVTLPENFAVIQPAMIRARRPRTEAETAANAPQPLIDWGSVDENDNDSLARIAAAELGAQVSPYVLSMAVTRIKTQIRQAKMMKKRNAMQSGSVTTQSPVHADPTPQYVPEHIRELVDSAERV